MNITAKELSGVHVTNRISVPFDGQQVTGTLIDVSHEASILTEQAVCEKEPRYGIGRQWVNITMWGNFEETESLTIKLTPATPVTIQEGQ